MTYQETLDYLFSRLPMYQRIGAAAYKKDLTNTLALLEHLGNPHQHFPSVHLAGTNGKGSTSHMLAAICQSAGLKTGLYISPHYKDFRERIKINGVYIPRRRVVSFVEKNRDIIEQIQPSFFELCVAMAFDHFAKEKVDVAIVETGLGGRLDSTNVITPLLSVITNISFDHMDMLGNTLPLIAGEKAGIIKPGVPVVIGETHPESAPVFRQKAGETGSDIVFADANYRVEPRENGNYRVFFKNKIQFERLAVDAGGPYQQHNIATMLQAAEDLKNILPITEQNITDGLANLSAYTRFMGRWQFIGKQPDILCDSAHNEA
ncbi:MAG: bifunctional folylpolyglutamate synthase/dihydrofolate synthase, partial [Saprospiraceae bacterium]|nr:bifunctional folylpolyglutamate synthase/dihydrofolate synthase [Saprospiraceae bacterium]